MRELRRNEKVGFDDVEGRLFYQPEINVKNKAAMLQKIQVSDKPVLLQTILEAYPKADQDVQVGGNLDTGVHPLFASSRQILFKREVCDPLEALMSAAILFFTCRTGRV